MKSWPGHIAATSDLLRSTAEFALSQAAALGALSSASASMKNLRDLGFSDPNVALAVADLLDESTRGLNSAALISAVRQVADRIDPHASP